MIDRNKRKLSKIRIHAGTRKFSALDFESDSIYKGKSLGFDHKELSIGEGISLGKGSSLIDKEVKGNQRKSLEFHLKSRNKSKKGTQNSLALSETPNTLEIFKNRNMGYMSSGEFHRKRLKKPKALTMDAGFENIDEESKDAGTPLCKSPFESIGNFEREIREAFIGNLKQMVNEVFQQLREEIGDSNETALQNLIKEKGVADSMGNKLLNSEQLPIDLKEFKEKNDHSFLMLNNLLSNHMQKSNKLKGMLIDVLMFLDNQVVQVSKIRRVVRETKEFIIVPEEITSQSPTNVCFAGRTDEKINEDMENVTNSWVDRHSLLEKDMQTALNNELQKLESPTAQNFRNLGRNQSPSNNGRLQYTKSLTPLKLFSQIFKTNNEKPKPTEVWANKSRNKIKTVPRNLVKKKSVYMSVRDYPPQNELKYNSDSYKFEKKSIFSMPHLGFITEKYKLKIPKTDKPKSQSILIKNKRSKNFAKKKTGFTDLIENNDEVKLLREKLVKGKRKDKVKEVQSMCTSKIENITESNIYIVKTRSGQEIKTKKCLDDVKKMLENFKRDLATKETRMRETHEDLQELRSSVLRLEFDLKQAKRVSGKGINFKVKEAEIREKTNQIWGLERETWNLSSEIEALTLEIEKLRKDNEKNLNDMTKVVKRKFREIESRNKKERQVHKDLMLKYNLELESKNEEINSLIGRYQELRLLNQDLSREVYRVKKRKPQPKSTQNSKPPRRNKSNIRKRNSREKSVRSKLSEDKIMKRADYSEVKLMKEIAIFENALNLMEKEMQIEGEFIRKFSKEKEESKKRIYDLEKVFDKKQKDLSRTKRHGDSISTLKKEVRKLEIKKAQGAKSLEIKHRMLKIREGTFNRFGEGVNRLVKSGQRLAHLSSAQVKHIILTREEFKRKSDLLKEHLKKEKYFDKMMQFKDHKLKVKTKKIELMNSKMNDLERQLVEKRRISKIREKSSNRYAKEEKTKSLIPSKKNKQCLSNFVALQTTKRKLYHNSGKPTNFSNLYMTLDPKFLNETLDSGKESNQQFYSKYLWRVKRD